MGCLRQGKATHTTERQSNTTQLTQSSHFSKKHWLPRVGFKPTDTYIILPNVYVHVFSRPHLLASISSGFNFYMLLTSLPHTCTCIILSQILKQENSQLQNRSQLVTQCSTGPQVFINCAGFIRIDTNAFSDA